MNIPKKYAEAKLSDFNDEIKAQVVEALSAGEVLTLIGPTGCGKTHLAMAVGRQRQNSIVFNMAEFAIQSQSEVSQWGMHGFQKWIDNIRKSTEIVIFDDLGAEKMTDFIHQGFVWVVSYREAEMLPLIITTNKTIREISESIDDRIASRMAGGMVMELDGEDRRLKGTA